MPYQTSQAQNDIQNTTQYTQTVNNHAFNTNSQSSTQTSHDISHLQDAVRPPSYGRLPPGAYDSMPAPLALPGLLNAISAQRSKAEPRVTRENQIHAVSTTAVDGESIEQAGSDLEEGELSEGIDPKSHLAHTPSRPRSAQQLSHTAKGRNTRGTPGGRPSASPHTAPDSDRLVQSTTNSNGLDASGDASMRHRQPSQMESSTVHLTANGRVNTSSTGRVHSPPIQQQPNKSSKVIKRGARRAVKQMRPHNIGYLQLIKEHIDMDLLKDLYAELKITVPEATHPGAFSANTETRTGLPAHYLDSDSQNPALAQSTDNLVPIADNLEPRQHYTFKAQSPLDQQGTHGAEAAEATSDGVSHEIHEDRADHSKGSNTVSEKAVTERLPLQTETGTNMGLAVAHSHDKTTTTSPAINGREPPTTQVTPQAPLQPSSTTSASKPPAPKLTAKPVDRKDYVARLLAAKAGKALPASNAPRPPPAPIPQKMGQDSASGPSHQAGKVHESDSVQIPDKDAPKEASALSKKVQNAAPQKSAADEAKKRAQTELARRKIEELKQRSEALKRSSSSVNEVPESSATKQLPPVEKPTQGHSVAITSSSTGSPTVQNTPRHSYFPLQNVPFALPGLFMSGQQNQPEQPSEPLRVASILEESQQGEEPKSVTAEAPDTGAGLHQRVAKVETFAPSKGENKVTIQTQRVEATTFEAISNPRKRPTAADFIEAMPAKSRRLNTSTADNNVVFDITDDEADESICDASEMQLDGEHGVRPNLEREPQISRSGSTGKPSVPQHPALNDPYTKAEQVKSTPSVALQVSQGPLKHTAPGGLRYNEEEIARMKRKIAEMEERRKLKQNASPAQTAGTPGQITSSVKPSDNYVNAFSTPGVIRCLSEETGHVEDREQTLGHVPNLDSTFQEESPSGQQGRQIEGTEEAQLLAESVNGPTTGLEERQQRQRRKAEIESRIPSMSATIEEYLSRLQKLQKEEADVQAQIQKQMNDKRALQEELDRLLQLSPSIMEESLQKGQEATTPQPIATQLQDAGKYISAPVARDS